MHPDHVLIKTSMVKALADRQMIKVPKPIYTSWKAYDNLVLLATLPGAKRPPCVASAFVGKCASIRLVDLIQWKKSDSWKFL